MKREELFEYCADAPDDVVQLLLNVSFEATRIKRKRRKMPES